LNIITDITSSKSPPPDKATPKQVNDSSDLL
jgi:hypothetical protein